MLTRCPACTTTFRVTPEQLKARHGKVRCGQCTTVFDALDSLVEEDGHSEIVAPKLGPASDTPHAAPPQEWSEPGIVTSEPDSREERPAAEVLPADSDHFERGPLAEPEQSSVEQTPAKTEIEVPDAIREAPEEQPAVAALSEPQDLQAPPAPASDAETAAPIAEAQVVPEENRKPPEDVRDMRAALGLPTGPTEAEASEPAQPPNRKVLWVVAAVLAGVALIGQIAMHFRVELTQHQPAFKPALLAACRVLGCDVPLPQQPTLLSLEGSNLYPDPDRKEQLILVATIRNRATFAQQFPHLELSLTDVNNRRLAVRAFKPGEYLPASINVAKGLAADEEITVNMTIDPQDLPVTGYLVYIFYP